MLQFLCSLCVCVLFSFSAFKEEKSGLPWWLSGKKIHLPMQETRVQSLVQEDPT